MKYGVYCIRDQLVGFMQPTIAVNDDAATRWFHMIVNDPSGTMISAQPQYYDLYCIGEFHDEDGSIVPLKQTKLIVTGLAIKKGDVDGKEVQK